MLSIDPPTNSKAEAKRNGENEEPPDSMSPRDEQDGWGADDMVSRVQERRVISVISSFSALEGAVRDHCQPVPKIRIKVRES